ncbi:MAG: Glu-tRNA(Gln) amidotransferase subunit GatE [Methanomicrobiales archaeon]|nr:Glu-tRNA(Gln) amidotransferase subunit GatE [Methanomicrobiales archaeon]
MDYERLGLKAGIEIHQQLDTEQKLFCRCPTALREADERNGEFCRYLRATESEMGEIDRAAEEEMMVMRRFRYYTYDTTCLVEADEEPPAPMNPEALAVALTIARLFSMSPVPQVHTMRKLVIDGSNTSGFQRTALVAMGGLLPNGGTVETICLEEEAAQRIDDQTFSLDRLGIPLVEITTSPCLHTPEAVQETAEYIGMVLRSTGRVKRGIGTIRQDINISIRDGARVEIKGVQDLDLIAETVRREVQRQQALLAIRDELRERGARVSGEAIDVTDLFKGTRSSILKKAATILAVPLPGFAGLVGRETQPGRRLGSEMADYARKCGVGGIFHTDELPAYGITAGEVARLAAFCGAGPQDAVVLVSGTPDRAACAARQVQRRAAMALEGVPEETRRMLEGGSTAYMRPLPGAARMYPETDVFPVEISETLWRSIPLPELLTERAERFTAELGLDRTLARQIAFSEQLPLFERAVAEGCRPALACRTLVGTLRELRRSGVATERLADAQILEVLRAVEEGRVAKEAVPVVLTAVAAGQTVDAAIEQAVPPLSLRELEALVESILSDRSAFVREKGRASLGPLMGVVMREVRGRVDGKVVSEVLMKKIGQMLGE